MQTWNENVKSKSKRTWLFSRKFGQFLFYEKCSQNRLNFNVSFNNTVIHLKLSLKLIPLAGRCYLWLPLNSPERCSNKWFHRAVDSLVCKLLIYHSCETVLVRIQSDIFRSIDDNRCVLLQPPLDLSASINDILWIILSNFERVSSRFNISCLVSTIRFFDCTRCPSPSKVQVWTSALLPPHVTHGNNIGGH